MQRPMVVAEIGQGKGRTDYITRAMRSARESGCWAAKIQLLQPETIAQPDAPVYWHERRRGRRRPLSTTSRPIPAGAPIVRSAVG